MIRNGKVTQITKDQSLVQQLIDAGQIQPEEAESHALKNVILQAFGAQNEIYPVAARLDSRRDDVLLICSDGLSNKINAADMREILIENFEKLEQACVDLVKKANERGGEDNITVILAKLTGSALPEPADEKVKVELLSIGNIHDTDDQDTAEIK